MKRKVFSELKSWATQKKRKPLLLRGARQVGKTYAVRELGSMFDNFVEINFEENEETKFFLTLLLLLNTLLNKLHNTRGNQLSLEKLSCF